MSTLPPSSPTALTWPAIFELWRDRDAPHDFRLAQRMAEDLSQPLQRVRHWRMRNFVPVWHWPRLIDVLETRFAMTVSYRQLVEATVRAREPRQANAREEAA